MHFVIIILQIVLTNPDNPAKTTIENTKTPKITSERSKFFSKTVNFVSH